MIRMISRRSHTSRWPTSRKFSTRSVERVWIILGVVEEGVVSPGGYIELHIRWAGCTFRVFRGNKLPPRQWTPGRSLRSTDLFDRRASFFAQLLSYYPSVR